MATERPPIYVNSGGEADRAAPYTREAIDRLKARARSAGKARATAAPGGGPAPVVNDTRKPSLINRARTAGSRVAGAGRNAAQSASGSGLINRARRIGGGLAGVAGAGQAAVGASQIASGDTVAGAENALYGTLTALPPTRGVGIIANALRAGRDAALEYGVDKFLDKGDPIVGPALEEQMAGRTPDEYVADLTVPSGQDGAAAPPARGGTPDASIGARAGDPGYVPGRGTGIIYNARKGTGREINADAGPQSSPPTETGPLPTDQSPAQVPVELPDASLVTDVDNMGEFLGQVSRAGQQIVQNKQAGAERRGIIAQKQGEADVRRTELENDLNTQIDSALEELINLDDTNDPDGSQRASLRQRLMDIRGSTQATDSPEARYERELVDSALHEGIVDDEGRRAAMQWVDDMMAQYRQRRGGGGGKSQYQEGMTYEDAQGNKAVYRNGKFEPV